MLPIKDFAEKNDLLLVATDGDGVLAYDRELKVLTPLRNYSNDFDLSKSKVHSLLCDKDNNMWMGIYQKGVLFKQANPNNFDYIGYKSEMKNIIGSDFFLSIYRVGTQVV